MLQKIENRKQKVENSSRQAGVTLLLAILILSSITLVTVAISAFAIQELRSSRAITISEPAVNAAETGSEQSLWAIKRDGVLPNCLFSSTNQNLYSSRSLVTSCRSYGNQIFSLSAGVSQQFLLYDPEDPIGDIDLQGCSGCIPASTNPAGYQYNTLTIKNNSTTTGVSVNLSRIDDTTTGLSQISFLLNQGETQTVTISPVVPGTEGRIQVTMQSSQAATVDVNTDKGVPSNLNLEASGCSSKGTISNCSDATQELSSRKIKVTLPQ